MFTKEEIQHAIASIKSLIDIDSFFEKWDDVALWKEQLADAEAELARAI